MTDEQNGKQDKSKSEQGVAFFTTEVRTLLSVLKKLDDLDQVFEEGQEKAIVREKAKVTLQGGSETEFTMATDIILNAIQAKIGTRVFPRNRSTPEKLRRFVLGLQTAFEAYDKLKIEETAENDTEKASGK